MATASRGVLFVILLVGSTIAAQVQERKIPQSLQKLLQSAESGNANSQFLVGAFFERGFDVTQDYKEAASWYRRAADQGHAGAQFALGQCYPLTDPARPAT